MDAGSAPPGVYRRALCFVIFTCLDASSDGVGGQLRLGDRRHGASAEQPSHEASGMLGEVRRNGARCPELLATLKPPVSPEGIHPGATRITSCDARQCNPFFGMGVVARRSGMPTPSLLAPSPHRERAALDALIFFNSPLGAPQARSRRETMACSPPMMRMAIL